MGRYKLRLLLVPIFFMIAACNGTSVPSGLTAGGWAGSGAPLPDPSNTSAPPAAGRTYQTDALIYDGAGTSESDAQALADLVDSHGLSRRVVNSDELNAMSAEELRSYGVIIWPGGTAKTMSDSLTAETRARIKDSIASDGVGFVGFCAGAFIAGTYAWSPTWGLELTPIDFPVYQLDAQGVSEAMVQVSFADGSSHDLVWYGGPELVGFGQVIGKYPEGGSAIAQEWIGKSLVVLSAVHPEAPESWRAGLSDSDGLDLDVAWTLINASLKQQPLKAF
jgi:glutamine amidotransferase-like uncharacterized protein